MLPQWRRRGNDRLPGKERVLQLTKSRLEAFSDGVFGIVVTLLVLDIRLPEVGGETLALPLGDQLMALVPKVASWLLSFCMASIIWVNHHHFTHQLHHVDRQLLWLNCLLLLFVSFLAFPSAVLGAHPLDATALRLFGVAFLLASTAFLAMRHYALAAGLYDENMETRLARAARRRSAVAVVLYLAGIASAGVAPLVAWFLYAAVAVYYVFPQPNQANARRRPQSSG